jgi:hypothetical protein
VPNPAALWTPQHAFRSGVRFNSSICLITHGIYDRLRSGQCSSVGHHPPKKIEPS